MITFETHPGSLRTRRVPGKRRRAQGRAHDKGAAAAGSRHRVPCVRACGGLVFDADSEMAAPRIRWDLL